MNCPLSSILEFYSNFKHSWSALEKNMILSTFKCTWWSSTLDHQVHLIKMQFYETQVHLIQAHNPYEVCFIQDTSVGVLNRTWWSSALDKGQFHKIRFINFSLSSVIESSALESSALHKQRGHLGVRSPWYHTLPKQVHFSSLCNLLIASNQLVY